MMYDVLKYLPSRYIPCDIKVQLKIVTRVRIFWNVDISILNNDLSTVSVWKDNLQNGGLHGNNLTTTVSQHSRHHTRLLYILKWVVFHINHVCARVCIYINRLTTARSGFY